ncbi:MAG: rhodanese-like domain-containing protein [Bacillota bacterium]
MKKISVILLIAAVFMVLSGCADKTKVEEMKESVENTQVVQQPQYSNISPQEAKERLDSEEQIILLDVRTKEEYVEKHITDSMLIPLDVLKAEAEAKIWDKDVPIFVYCRSGRRSAQAADILVKLGYTNVYNLGGIIDWPYETVVGE